MRRAWIATTAVVATSVTLELAFHHSAHPELWWHSLPAFDFAYGFLGCGAIVLASKWVGHALLQRDEDYYENDS